MQRHFREALSVLHSRRAAQIKKANQTAYRRTLRNRYRRNRRALSQSTQQHNAAAVARHLQVSTLPLRSATIGAYLPFYADGELDTAPLLTRLWSMGRAITVPVVAKRQPIMNFYHYEPHDRVVTNRFNIPEPEPGSRFAHRLCLSLLLVPLVAFDERGTRLGMGGGFYDRFLSAMPVTMRPRIVGLAHEVQRSEELLPASTWDVPLDGVVTEAGWQQFTPGRLTEGARMPQHR